MVLLAVAAVGATLALVVGPGRDGPAAAERYRCPMHPDVGSPVPAACPICGMALVRDTAPGLAPVAAGDAPDRALLARAGRRIFSEDVRAPAWVETSGDVIAMLYRDDLVGLAPDQPAQFFPATAPRVGVDVSLAADPPADWDGSTASARFRVVASGAAAPRPGEHGVLAIPARARELLVVPAGAVLPSPEGAHVLALGPDGRFHRKPVAIGRAHRGVVVVLAGLVDGQVVAAADAFLLDAERRLRPEEAP
jgi:hypothetical protein